VDIEARECGVNRTPAVDGRTMRSTIVNAEPEPIACDLERTALVIIDMQRDFLEPGGFGETLGNDVSLLSAAIKPCKALLDRARQTGMLVIHTREGHRPDMADAPRAKVERGAPSLRIGAPGPMGRILIRGSAGHDIVPELYPQEGEPVVDKPGKGAFHATDLHSILHNQRIENLIVCGPRAARRHPREVAPRERAAGRRPYPPDGHGRRLTDAMLNSSSGCTTNPVMLARVTTTTLAV
jgi:nicotinamidase-related amidase